VDAALLKNSHRIQCKGKHLGSDIVANRGQFLEQQLLFLLRVLIRIDDFAGLVFRGPQDHLAGCIAELRQVVAGDVLELGDELARLFPFAVLAERELTGDEDAT